jgi:asparagine synthase (glutamine-hydrolysing)
MCGIVGIINKTKKNVLECEVREMCSKIIHRGPDDEGTYIHKNVGIGMRRLNIIDLNTGQQPIHNEDRTLWIVFNGEIYNYKEVRDWLKEKHHKFYTESDTEVIIHAYEEEGERCLERLRGMFAFIIYDQKNNQVFVARDRFGIKPLFFCETKDYIYIASEMKSMLFFEDVEKNISWKAFDAFFTLSYIPAPMTIYDNIFKLMPGHYMMIKNGKISLTKYWDLHFHTNDNMSEDSIIETFLSLFEDAVKIHLVSDVPVGAFLSGGIDSSSVVAMMAKYHQSVSTLSIGFGGAIGAYDDERKYARMVSKRYRTSHREYEVSADLCDAQLLESIVEAFDEPFADHGVIPTYFVCKMAKQNMTVCLSGLGGDELFAGYSRYYGFALSEVYQYLPGSLKRNILPWIVEKLPESKGGKTTVNRLKRFVRGGGYSPDRRYLTFLDLLSGYSKNGLFSPDVLQLTKKQHFDEDFLSYFRSNNASDSLNKVFYTDIKTYLPDDILALTDRVSMMHSLEVRVPFLDHKLVEFCATIPSKMKMKYLRPKYLLKKAVSPLLPKDILRHKKQGFVGPMSVWLNYQLKDYIYDTLFQKSTSASFFQRNAISDILTHHFNGEQLNTSLIWSLLVFNIWHTKYMENSKIVRRL